MAVLAGAADDDADGSVLLAMMQANLCAKVGQPVNLRRQSYTHIAAKLRTTLESVHCRMHSTTAHYYNILTMQCIEGRIVHVTCA